MDGAVAATATLKKATDPQQYPHTPEDLRKEPNYPIWVRLRAGDRSARDELVVRYAPLVKYVIGRMAISLPAARADEHACSTRPPRHSPSALAARQRRMSWRKSWALTRPSLAACCSSLPT